MLASMMLVLFVFALVVLYWRLDLLLANPCWEDVLEGLNEIKPDKDATLVLSGECVKKIVFATSKTACRDACEIYKGSDEHKLNCLEKCEIWLDNEPNTVVVAVPVEAGDENWWIVPGTGYVKRVGRALGRRNVLWLFGGSPRAFNLDCFVKEFDKDKKIQECKEGTTAWECTPGSKESTHTIELVEEGMSCVIRTA
jgi:hypothetical protein